jgi:hypothetical protein
MVTQEYHAGETVFQDADSPTSIFFCPAAVMRMCSHKNEEYPIFGIVRPRPDSPLFRATTITIAT